MSNDNTSAQVSAWIETLNENDKYWEDYPNLKDNVKEIHNILGSYQPDFTLGDIRTLDPSFTTSPHLGTQVAVLQRWTDHSHLIAPLSRLSLPAVRGEIKTSPGYVVEVWNAKIVPDTLIKKGWYKSSFLFLDDLTEEDTVNCRDLFRHLTINKPLRDSFSGKVGPKLSSVSDPRYKWMIDERQRWKPLDILIQEELIKLYNA